jgi:hypothetical protein
MTLSDPIHWSPVFKGSFYLAQSGSYKGRIEPILTTPFSQSTIRFYAKSIEAKPSWKYAGELTLILGVEEMEIMPRFQIYLNRWSLIFVPQLVLEYRLKFEPAYWHKQMEVFADVYDG